MTDSDSERFATAMGALGVAHGRQITTEVLRVYWESLKVADIADVEKAIAAAVDNEPRFPPPAILRKHAGVAPTPPPPPPPSIDEEAQAAWNDLRSQIGSVGWIGTPKLTEMQERAMRSCGSWSRLCACNSIELDHLSRSFIASYKAMAGRPGYHELMAGQERGRINGEARAAIAGLVGGLAGSKKA